MDVWCEICEHRWDSRDPGVRYIYAEGVWECWNEMQCFGRRSAAREMATVPLRIVRLAREEAGDAAAS